jgi:hypothetical protein
MLLLLLDYLIDNFLRAAAGDFTAFKKKENILFFKFDCNVNGFIQTADIFREFGGLFRTEKYAVVDEGKDVLTDVAGQSRRRFPSSPLKHSGQFLKTGFVGLLGLYHQQSQSLDFVVIGVLSQALIKTDPFGLYQ